MMQAPAFLPNLGVDLCEEDPLTSPGAGLQKALHSRSQAMRKCLVTQPFDIVPTFRLQRAAKLAAQCLYENRRTRLQLYDYTTLIVLETLSPSAAGLESFI